MFVRIWQNSKQWFLKWLMAVLMQCSQSKYSARDTASWRHEEDKATGGRTCPCSSRWTRPCIWKAYLHPATHRPIWTVGRTTCSLWVPCCSCWWPKPEVWMVRQWHWTEDGYVLTFNHFIGCHVDMNVY